LISATEFAGLLQKNLHPLQAAKQVPGLLSQPCETALNSAHANGSLASFYRSWLAQTVDDRTTWTRHEDTHAAALGRLGLRTVICLFFIIFILLRVIPEHQKMYEEFGLEANTTMKMFLTFSNWFAGVFAPIMGLCITLFALYVICFRRSMLQNYFQRWLPGSWRQTNLPRSVLRRKLMAWDLLALDAGDKPENELVDWDSFVKSRDLSSREATTMKSVNSMETKAWLLRNMSDRKHENRKSRFAFAVHLFIYLVQAVLGVFIILATFTIFSMLLKMMRSLA
jgi:ABC-type multidrug transport system fused ATPase/permease subunit